MNDPSSLFPGGLPRHEPIVEYHDLQPGPLDKAITDQIHIEQSKGKMGLIFGVLIIFSGIVMIVSGITGSVDLVVNSGGTSLHITTAVVGVVVALIGLAVIIVTDSKVRLWFAKDK